jgi:hypothetical protein
MVQETVQIIRQGTRLVVARRPGVDISAAVAVAGTIMVTLPHGLRGRHRGKLWSCYPRSHQHRGSCPAPNTPQGAVCAWKSWRKFFDSVPQITGENAKYAALVERLMLVTYWNRLGQGAKQ